MGRILHHFSNQIPDGTNTNIVRPSDWNSVHDYTIQDAVSLSGNTSGVLGNVSSGTLYLAGGNNITLSQNGNSVTISGANAGGAQTGISGIGAGGATATSGTVVFSNSNGVSFGVNGQTLTASVKTDYLTTAMRSDAATLSNVKVSASGGSVLGSDFTFANSNGLTFGIDTALRQITGSYTVPNVPAQSNQTVGWYASSNTTLTSSGTADARSLSVRAVGSLTAGFSGGELLLSAPAALTSQSNQNVTAGNGGFAFQTLSFSNANGLSFGTSAGSAITGSYTVPTQTNQSAIKALGASNTGNTAGNTGVSTGVDWVLAGTNNVTVSESTTAGGPNTLWLSGPTVGGAQTGISGIQVSDTTFTSGTITFRNANGISFGSSGANGITASYTVPNVPAQTAGSDTAGISNLGNTAGTSGVISGDQIRLLLAGGNNVTLSQSINGSSATVTISAFNQSVQTQGITTDELSIGASNIGNTSGNTTVQTGQRFVLAGGNNVTLSQSTAAGSTTLTISAFNQSNQTEGLYAVGNTTGQSSSSTFDARTVSFSGAGNVSVGYSAGNVVISGASAAPSPVNFSAGTTSGNLGSVVFSNSNGVSFGLSGSTITGSVAAGGGGGVAVTVGGNNTTGTLTLVSSGTLTLAGSADIWLSQDGNGLTISNSDPPVTWWANQQVATSQQPTSTYTAKSLFVMPLSPQGAMPGDITANTIHFRVSGSGATASSSAHSFTFWLGFYVPKNATQLTLDNSGSSTWGYAANTGNSSNYHGQRILSFDASLFATSPPVLTRAGNYYMALLFSTSNFAPPLSFAAGDAYVSAGIFSGTIGVGKTTGATSSLALPFGPAMLSVSTNGLPNSIAASDLVNAVSALGQRMPLVYFHGLCNIY